MSFLREEINLFGRILSIETGKYAKNASGSVMVRYGDTTILCTVVWNPASYNETINFVPLSVNYQERFSSSGKIFGNKFIKREGKPSEREIIISRLIDRSIRPMLKGVRNEIQVNCILLSYDPNCPSDVTSIIGVSAALLISGLSVKPLAAMHVTFNGENYLFNEANHLNDIIVVSNEKGVVMLEGIGNSIKEKDIINCIGESLKQALPIINLLDKFIKNQELLYYIPPKIDENIILKYYNQAKEIFSINERKLKDQKIINLSNLIAQEQEVTQNEGVLILDTITQKVIKDKILNEKTRIDGRKQNELRNMQIEMGIFPRSHGSALFSRGGTQILAYATLGTKEDIQLIADITGDYSSNFMLDYYFFPFSAGEIGRPGVSRREIGHAKLAHKSIVSQIQDNLYTTKVIADVTESDGGTSMCTVSAAVLAMINAGVKLKNPVAGVAMGMIKDENQNIVLSDICKDEDAVGSMDMKIAGTKNGLTAIQMDIKEEGISLNIIEETIKQASQNKEEILHKMSMAIPQELKISEYVPHISQIVIKSSQIGDLIGSSGKTIKFIAKQSESKISVDDDGIVNISTFNDPAKEKHNLAIKMVNLAVYGVQVGHTYDAVVKRIEKYGVFAEIIGKYSGLIHISEKTREVDMQELIKVKVIGIKDRKLSLSMKL